MMYKRYSNDRESKNKLESKIKAEKVSDLLNRLAKQLDKSF